MNELLAKLQIQLVGKAGNFDRMCETLKIGFKGDFFPCVYIINVRKKNFLVFLAYPLFVNAQTPV